MKQAIIKLNRGGEVRQTPDPHSMATIVQIVGEEMEVSDTYHTIDELYDHRITLFIALCKAFATMNNIVENTVKKIWRSEAHSDGSKWDGWFILGIDKAEGEQITYHLPMTRWDDTEFAETLEVAPKFDGHTAADVLVRLKAL